MIKTFSTFITWFMTSCMTLCIVPVSAVAEEEVDADVIIRTSFGEMALQMFPDVAPGHVENFLKLAESGFYDGTLFHRVIPGFMIQGGDPKTKEKDTRLYGTGGPGYYIKAEFNATSHKRGILSMARSQHPDSAGSQFFITVADATFLDGKYTVFGKVLKGMEVADKIVSQPRNNRDLPLEPIPMTVEVLKRFVGGELRPVGKTP